ncbi:pentatricopeptide repeat-containing family protein [Striga asiatica]|uniref:Pentatricopeptide repeat-containing family protein n=1 Tax=Striga asiatica TaxID=4170 RepID=A0A5A7R4B1_STRAF|nr:pentatricopeptide repeat-containing family protein [Striga asiatica]
MPHADPQRLRHLSQRGRFADALSLHRQPLGWGLGTSSHHVRLVFNPQGLGPNFVKMGRPTTHKHVLKIELCGAIFVQMALVDFYSKLRDRGVLKFLLTATLDKSTSLIGE